MELEIAKKETTEVRQSPIIQQTGLWARVKEKQGDNSLAQHYQVHDENGIFQTQHEESVSADLLVLLRHLDTEHSFAYVPYGPRTEPLEEKQGLLLEELSENLAALLPSSCFMIRYDLPWESPWAREDSFYNEENHWLGPPEKRNQEFRFNFNTRNWNLHKANTNVLPANTIFMDLKKSPDELLSGMKPKTRYNIRLAGRRGVKVRISGPDDLPVWHKLYSETAGRNNINYHDKEYFRTVLATASGNKEYPEEILLLIAEKDKTPVAAMFLGISGLRGTYLYGASGNRGRNSMATYALQWEAIRILQQRGCTEYDMFGVSPGPDPSHPMYGLYRFKKGFGGNLFHRMGCWDYPLKSQTYRVYSSGEMKAPAFHL